MLPQHSQKPFSLYKFSGRHVFVWCQKKYLHCTLSWRPRTAFLMNLQMSVYFYISPYKNVCSRDVVRFYLKVVGLRGDWIISLRQFTFCASKNILQYFILIEIFENSTIFQHFDTLSIALKRWSFTDNLNFKGKTVVKFLIRSHFLST